MIATKMLPVGVEVLGFDFAQSVDSETKTRLRHLLDEHQLLVFKGQELSDDQHLKAMEVFGPTMQEQGEGHCSFVSNARPDGVLGDIELPFHIDYCFRACQSVYVSLYGYEVEGASMPTGYFNSVSAVGHLPSSLRQQLEGRYAVHARHDQDRDQRSVRLLDSPNPSAYRQKRRPIFQSHPKTAATMLALYELFTSHIDGLSSKESDELLEEIFSCIYAKPYLYFHFWKHGDLVVWDNVAVHHSRRLIEGTVRETRRTLRRVAVSEHDCSVMLPMAS